MIAIDSAVSIALSTPGPIRRFQTGIQWAGWIDHRCAPRAGSIRWSRAGDHSAAGAASRKTWRGGPTARIGCPDRPPTETSNPTTSP